MAASKYVLVILSCMIASATGTRFGLIPKIHSQFLSVTNKTLSALHPPAIVSFATSIEKAFHENSCNLFGTAGLIDLDFQAKIKQLSELSVNQTYSSPSCPLTAPGLDQQYRCSLRSIYQRLSQHFLQHSNHPGSSCQVFGCSPPRDIDHGSWTCDHDGLTCHLVCHIGYRVVTDATQSVFPALYTECHAKDSSWIPAEEKFKCVCGGRPRDPPGGEWQCADLNGVWTCTLRCRQGMVAKPQDTAHCCGERWSDKMDSFRCQAPDIEAPLSSFAKADDVIFISGGFNNDNYKRLFSTEVLDPTGNCSGFTHPLCEGRSNHPSLFHNNSVVICSAGGSDPKCIYSKTPATGGWRFHSNTTSNRFLAGSAVAGDSMVLVGGLYNHAAQTIESFEGGDWVNGTALPHRVGSDSCLVAVGEDRVVVSGGSSSEEKVAEYNLRTKEWRLLPDLPEGRKGHGCGFIEVRGKKKVVVAGGYKLRSTYALDLESQVWSKIGDMKSVRYEAQMVRVGNNLLMMGGSSVGTRELLYSVEKMGQNLRWRSMSIRMKKERYNFSATVVPRALVCKN